jgi:hypothetical protein
MTSRLAAVPLRAALLGAVLLAGLVIPFPAPWAQPVRDGVLEEVRVADTPDAWEVDVVLSFPARYERHFPPGRGDELRVRMTPLAVGEADRPGVLGREAVRPEHADALGLEQVMWEGDVDEGPYLTFLFRRPVSFWIRQGKDFRSLVVTIPKPGPDDPAETP